METASTSRLSVVMRPKLAKNKKVSWEKNISNALNGTKQHASSWSKRQTLSQKKAPQLSQSSNTKSQSLFGRGLESPCAPGQRTVGQRSGRDDQFMVSLQIRASSIVVNAKGLKDEFRDIGAWAVCRLPHTPLRLLGLGQASLTLKAITT